MPLGRTQGGWNDEAMRAGIALGSNVGDRLAHLRKGRDLVLELHDAGRGTPSIAPLYETDPVDCPPGSACFLNTVLEITTALPPEALHERLAAIEETLGRPRDRSGKNLPRCLDLDFLYADDLRLATSPLRLPHPRMTERRFVLQPLADIRPGLVLPGETRSVAALLAALPPGPAVRLFAADW